MMKDLDSNGDVNGNVVEKDDNAYTPSEVGAFTLTEKVVEYFVTLKWYHYVLYALMYVAGFLNVWESPEKKVADEWKACNTIYADRCYYVGTRFHTGDIEMAIAQKLYRTSDEDIQKLRKP